MAYDAARPAELANNLSLFSRVENRWNVGTYTRQAPRRSTKGLRPRTNAERGNRRQPVGKDDGKRGPHGYDAGKKINGRKRHILVDVLGLILAVVVHPADIQDRDGAKLVLEKITHAFSRLRLIWADGGYAGRLIEWVYKLRRRGKVTLEIVKRNDDIRGFKVLPKRWIVERTFGWLGRWRRLSKDYEYLTSTSEIMIRIAMIGLMTRRLAEKRTTVT